MKDNDHHAEVRDLKVSFANSGFVNYAGKRKGKWLPFIKRHRTIKYRILTPRFHGIAMI